jgi:uncharacterized repeat protein (TIGR03803 family)
MSNYGQHRLDAFKTNFRAVIAALTLTVLLALVLAIVPAAQAQTYTVLHNFTGGGDGANPEAGVTLDGAGNLYGTTYAGGAGYGAVYQLKHKSGWPLNPLYKFHGGDGSSPRARLIFGPNSILYGTTYQGGTGECNGIGGAIGCGVVFNLRPPATAPRTALTPWTETVLTDFYVGGLGLLPGFGDLIFDQAGNIYGTTSYGYSGQGCGGVGCGDIYELTPSGSGWTGSVLYDFSGSDGANPYNGVIFDQSGNLYGTTDRGGRFGNGYGTVFQLSSVSGESLIHSFSDGNGNDGAYPIAGVIFDSSFSNLYGASSDGGPGGGGVVFKLSLSGAFTPLYSFTGTEGSGCPTIIGGEGGYGPGPWASLTMDAAGDLYGTTVCDGAYGYGNVFKLTPPYGQQNYTSLYDFCSAGPPCSDGEYPISNVSFDTSGNLYGTASAGGTQGVGVVWEITP